MKKVVVIGLDGLEPTIVERLAREGSLPNLERLRLRGGYARIRTTYPALTPVAWSTFATGTNPGGHGIFDFVRRNPKTYLPDLSFSRYEQKNAFVPPRAVNLRRGRPIWEALSARDVPCSVVRFPCTYPPDNVRGRMLSGMGVPDIRGGLGTSTFFSEADDAPGESEQFVRVRVAGSDRFETRLPGPRDPKSGGDIVAPLTVELHPGTDRITVRAEGAPPLEVREGRWSDWLKVRFKVGLLRSARGMVRFHLVQKSPVFELYASPVNFDPEAPLFPISSPPEFAKQLEGRIGTYYTTGMVEEHGGLSNGRLSEAAYLDQCRDVMRERERMMHCELDRLDEGFFFCLFDTPDRVQHMFWRFSDPEHPANRGEVERASLDVIERHYRECDEVVGRVLEHDDGDTLIAVVSDHGMSSFRRGVHVNGWLHAAGLLALKDGAVPGDPGDFFRHVDWDRTKAYSLGLSGIFLNLRGREGRGVVDPAEAERVAAGIAAGLGEIRDPVSGAAPVTSVLPRERVYSGAYAAESPDLVVNFDAGYRMSWSSALGGVPEGIFEDNTKKWSGDHSVDPALVPGVLFMNRPFDASSPGLADMAPTVLAALGAGALEEAEGRSLIA